MTNETRWTPGKWTAICGGPYDYKGSRLVTAEVMTVETRSMLPGRGYRDDPHDVDNVEVAKVATFQDDISVDELHANAHLIASAPDLYAALDHLVDILECELGGPHPTLDRGYAALARASGDANLLTQEEKK